MNKKEMDKFISHCDKHFNQSDCTVLHAVDNQKPHIDVLLYIPNEEYPFWKLVTMGASDFSMPNVPNALGFRNEYMMFIDPSEDLTDRNVVGWYYSKLMGIAHYPIQTKSHISYGHSIEWGEEDESDMVAAFLEMPQMIADVSFLRCRLGLLKPVVICLQAITLTRKETEELLRLGPQQFSEYLYPEESENVHYLCERYRSEKF